MREREREGGKSRKNKRVLLKSLRAKNPLWIYEERERQRGGIQSLPGQ